jgi:hypothetical protein
MKENPELESLNDEKVLSFGGFHSSKCDVRDSASHSTSMGVRVFEPQLEHGG